MLSDEEKEALKNFKSEYETCDHYSSDLIIELDDAEIILNLIEKQQKEIEELKDFITKLQATKDRLDSYDKENTLEIEKLNKEIEELKEENEKYKNPPFFDEENYTSNAKIKAKIEEVEQWELYNMKIPKLSTLDERLGAKVGIKYVLQSLLEKE